MEGVQSKYRGLGHRIMNKSELNTYLKKRLEDLEFCKTAVGEDFVDLSLAIIEAKQEELNLLLLSIDA